MKILKYFTARLIYTARNIIIEILPTVAYG